MREQGDGWRESSRPETGAGAEGHRAKLGPQGVAQDGPRVPQGEGPTPYLGAHQSHESPRKKRKRPEAGRFKGIRWWEFFGGILGAGVATLGDGLRMGGL